MTHSDNSDDSPSDKKVDQQLGFKQGDFSDTNPRRLEPVFDDIEEPDEQLPDNDSDGYSNRYQDDTIDYEIYSDDSSESDAEDHSPDDWFTEELKPEFQIETSSQPEQQPAVQPEENDNWSEEPPYEQDEVEDGPWPIGLIAVAIFALVLLGAGGYGVMQQRAEMQEEIRSLQAKLATTVSPEIASDNREKQRELEERNTDLQASVESLQLEIRSLSDTVHGLEGQLEIAQTTVTQQQQAAEEARKQPPKPVKPAPTPKPTAAAAADTAGWFVNFSSYSNRQTAQTWADRLKPANGKVVVVSVQRNGNTFFRVRIVGLSNKSQAESVASSLEKEYKLSKLWVGEQ